MCLRRQWKGGRLISVGGVGLRGAGGVYVYYIY